MWYLSVIIVISALELAAAAVVARVIALKKQGRRFPVCKGCRYDVSGLLPAETPVERFAIAAKEAVLQCPECGKSIGPMSVEIIDSTPSFRREKFIAGVLTSTGVAVFVALSFALPTCSGQASSNSWKPTWLLRRNALAGSASSLIALTEKLKNDALSDELIYELVEAGLRRRHQWNEPWVPEWADFIEAAEEEGKATSVQRSRYRTGFVRAEARTRSPLRPGDGVPLLLELREARLSRQGSMRVTAEIERVAVDKQPIGPDEMREPMQSHWMSRRIWVHDHSLNPRDAYTFPFYLPLSLDPGEHHLEVQWNLTAIDIKRLHDINRVNQYGAQLGELVTSPAGRGELGVWEYTWRGAVEVAEEAPAAPAAMQRLATEKDIRACVRRVAVSRGQDHESDWAYVGFVLDRLPVAVAFDVLLAQHGEEHSLGSVVQSAGDSFVPWELRAQLNRFDADRVTLVLRTSAVAARESVSPEAVWEGEIRFDDVEVERVPR